MSITKKIAKNALNVGIFILSLGLFATAGFIVYNKFFANKISSHVSGIPLLVSKKTNPSTPVDIVEYSLTDYKNDDNPTNDDQDEIFFLGEKGRKELIKRINSNLQFGTEITQLKTIYINRGPSFISKKANGQYTPQTAEIDINLDGFSADLIKASKDLSPSEKVDLIFPTIYHEYYHHFSNIYLGYGSKYIEDIVNHKSGVFATKFLREWMSYLNYNKSWMISFQEPRDSLNAKNPNQIYSTKELFRIANTKDDKFADFKYALIDNLVPSDAENLKYLYSFEELFTRKFQEISYLPYPLDNRGKPIEPHPDSPSKWFGVYQGINSTIPNFNSFTTELLKNRHFGWNREKIMSLREFEENWKKLDSINGENDYIRDNPYNPSKDINYFGKLYQELSGYGAPISQIYEENTSYITGSEGDNLIANIGKNTNKVKISGFVKKEDYNAFKFVRIGGKDGTQFKVHKPTKYKYSNIKFKLNPWDLTWTGNFDEKYVPYLATSDDNSFQSLKETKNKDIEFGFADSLGNIRWEIINKKTSAKHYLDETNELANYRLIGSLNKNLNSDGFVLMNTQLPKESPYSFELQHFDKISQLIRQLKKE